MGTIIGVTALIFGLLWLAHLNGKRIDRLYEKRYGREATARRRHRYGGK